MNLNIRTNIDDKEALMSAITLAKLVGAMSVVEEGDAITKVLLDIAEEAKEVLLHIYNYDAEDK